jgi:hypothetical protein
MKKYFNTIENLGKLSHPFHNNSTLVKVGHKYLYFKLENNKIIKIDMNKYFSQFCI